MRYTIERGWRPTGVAVLFVLLATSLLFLARPAAYGDDKALAQPLAPELAKAIRDGDVKAVRAHLDGGADVNARDTDGNTPLLLAASHAATNYAKARLLIDAGASIRVTTELGKTPLTLAAYRRPWTAASPTGGTGGFPPRGRVGPCWQ